MTDPAPSAAPAPEQGFNPARPRDLWVVGDVHGAHDKLRALLMGAGLLGKSGDWAGGRAHLVFLGDYVDRGPDSIGVLRLVQQLEQQARRTGGQVTALLGNHEVMFLAAAFFQEHDPQDRLGFLDYWMTNGGHLWDLERLTPEDIAWIQSRPMLARADEWLLTHADSLFYLGMGHSIEDVNVQGRTLLKSTEPSFWGAFANAFVDRLNYAGQDGASQARKMLLRYGGMHIVHGHTPTYLLLNETQQYLIADPFEPVVYSDSLCVAADSGMAYVPEAGFIARLGYTDWGEKLVRQVVSLPEAFSALPRG